jgi:cobalamin biosynthesis protein CobD/CbiB
VSLVGLAWNLATFLVVPVLVIEGQGPIDAIRRSASLLKQTWGEQIAGNLSIGLIFGLITFGLAVVLIAPASYLAASFNQPLVLIPVGLVLILAIVLISLISSTLQGIYAAAVYRFATEGDAGPFFHPDLVQGAFRSG